MNVDIKHLAKLARLKILDDEVVRFEKEMSDIISMVANLPEIDGKSIGVDENHPMQCREDIIKPSLKRSEILKNTPQVQAGCIVVPKVVE